MRIITVGKKHEYMHAVAEYEKRLRGQYVLDWAYIPHSSRGAVHAHTDESDRILAKLQLDDYVILLDERGTSLTSPGLAELVEHELGRNITFVIGGAYGVSDELRDRADFVWSLSELVFPHQLVRLIVTEQLYRAYAISHGLPYHHA